MADDNTPAYTFYADAELTEDTIKYEKRKRTIAVVSLVITVRSSWQSRWIRTKKYECTIRDVDPSEAELPAPTYMAGNNHIELNPEGLAPLGYDVNEWHMIDCQYTKVLDEPLSRRYSITWEQYGPWFTLEEDSDSE